MRLLIAAAAVLGLIGTGQAVAATPDATGASAPGRIADPLEGWNRGVYGFNNSLDRAVLRPLAITYGRSLPSPARDGVRNVIANLGAPVVFVNDVLQVRPTPAANTAFRFAVNTTVGLLGVFDVASPMGVPRHKADFGQTLGRYGVATGPYIYLPVLGPSSLRDTVGFVVNTAIDPVTFSRFDGAVPAKVTVITLNALDMRVIFDRDIKDLQHTATDPYAATRSIWVQNREAFINGDAPPKVDDLSDFTPDATPKPR
jgi:phospholipid-binding lipoprotein MlaA